MLLSQSGGASELGVGVDKLVTKSKHDSVSRCYL